jgi:SAM-dependent methyltransferase
MEDVWSQGRIYERYMGRWSRLVAAEFVAWLEIPPGRRWLDVGCGTGALAGAILARAAPAGVLAVDPSPGFVAAATEQLADARARTAVADAAALPDAEVDVVVSGLVLNFVADPAAALAAMRRATPGGTVAAYVWDYAAGMQFLRHFWDAAVAVDGATAGPLDESTRFPLCRPDRLEALWRESGLDQVRTAPITVPTVFADFDDYWLPFLGGQGPAPTYVASLDDAAGAALRDRLRATLPTGDDGTIALSARAWAVRGLVPGSAR